MAGWGGGYKPNKICLRQGGGGMRNTTEKLRAIIATTPYYYLKKGCYTKSCFHYLLLKNALCISLGVSLVGAGRGGGGGCSAFLVYKSKCS